jgi:hypothetical protein
MASFRKYAELFEHRKQSGEMAFELRRKNDTQAYASLFHFNVERS